jgi:dihydrofolate synthase / folylpolyglutamate synthase
MFSGLAHLSALKPSDIKMGLSRVQAALALLGHPEQQFKAVHVAGTNGKGSTCAFLESMLRQRYRTGLYTSPHLERVNERIQECGIEISDAEFNARIGEVLSILTPQHELTFFEFSTVVAFWHFARSALDIAILETGLGGRLDATTACQPLVTCVTPIGLDHQEYLGTSLSSIAREKAGIFKKNVPVICAAQTPEAGAVLAAVAEELRAPMIIEGTHFIGLNGFDYQSPTLKLSQVSLPLLGPHQTQNAALAVACVEALTPLGFPLHAAEIATGLTRTQWPGRLEKMGLSPEVVLDGAHNPHGVRALVTALRTTFSGQRVHLVFGVFRDKDFGTMLRELAPQCASVALVKLAGERAADPIVLKTHVLNHPQVSCHQSVPQGIAAARSRSNSEDLIVIAGSLTLVAEARRQLTVPT